MIMEVEVVVVAVAGVIPLGVWRVVIAGFRSPGRILISF